MWLNDATRRVIGTNRELATINHIAMNRPLPYHIWGSVALEIGRAVEWKLNLGEAQVGNLAKMFPVKGQQLGILFDCAGDNHEGKRSKRTFLQRGSVFHRLLFIAGAPSTKPREM